MRSRTLALNMIVHRADEVGAKEKLVSFSSYFDEVVIVADGSMSRDFARYCRDNNFYLDQTRRQYFHAAPARRLALARTESDWVFVIDPDEKPSQALLDGLEDLIQVEGQGAYWIRIRYLLDGELQEDFWHPRLFRITTRTQWPPYPHMLPMGLGLAASDGVLTFLEDEASFILHSDSSLDYPDKEERYTSVVAGLLPRYSDLLEVRKHLLEVLSRYENETALRLKEEYAILSESA